MSPPNGKRPPHHLSPEDREWLQRRIDDRGFSVPQIAERIGVKRQTLYYLLSGRTQSFSRWPELIAAVGGTPPSGIPVVLDERLKEIARRWPELSEADKAWVEQFVRRVVKLRP